jgi:hypothetical protein
MTYVELELGSVTRSKLPLKPHMEASSPQLGTCPFCDAEVPREAVLIEYEVDGESRLFAECYQCNEPVQPQ